MVVRAAAAMEQGALAMGRLRVAARVVEEMAAVETVAADLGAAGLVEEAMAAAAKEVAEMVVAATEAAVKAVVEMAVALKEEALLEEEPSEVPLVEEARSHAGRSQSSRSQSHTSRTPILRRRRHSCHLRRSCRSWNTRQEVEVENTPALAVEEQVVDGRRASEGK